MNRGTPAYIEAVQRVKISFFTEQLGLDIRGIMHVGANDGYEMQFYRAMGITRLAGVEPNPEAAAKFRAAYPDIPLWQVALGGFTQRMNLCIPDPKDGSVGDGQGASLLMELHPSPDFHYNRFIEVEVVPAAELPCAWHLYDCLVMDVQGFELPALIGFGQHIRTFKMLSVECSREPVYAGEAPAQAVEDYLKLVGFTRVSPIEEHNDVFFVKNYLVKEPARD